jgi:hypothetical protein
MRSSNLTLLLLVAFGYLIAIGALECPPLHPIRSQTLGVFVAYYLLVSCALRKWGTAVSIVFATSALGLIVHARHAIPGASPVITSFLAMRLDSAPMFIMAFVLMQVPMVFFFTHVDYYALVYEANWLESRVPKVRLALVGLLFVIGWRERLVTRAATTRTVLLARGLHVGYGIRRLWTARTWVVPWARTSILEATEWGPTLATWGCEMGDLWRFVPERRRLKVSYAQAFAGSAFLIILLLHALWLLRILS